MRFKAVNSVLKRTGAVDSYNMEGPNCDSKTSNIPLSFVFVDAGIRLRMLGISWRMFFGSEDEKKIELYGGQLWRPQL